MGWSQWYALGYQEAGIVAQSINSCLNVFGRLELFAKSSDSERFLFLWQTIWLHYHVNNSLFDFVTL
jgi:hypothetical protein